MQAWALMGMLGVAAVIVPDHAAAAPKKAPAAKPAQGAAPNAPAKADPAAAARVLDTGIKAYEAGKFDTALTSLNQALQGGGLNSQQMAKALYYRGLTYRKQGKPALAISDLTSAVWLKGGLSDAEKADAQENRAAAYQEAGLSETPSSGSSSGSSKAAGVPATASSWQTATTEGTASAAQPKSSSSSGVGGFFSNIFGGGSSASAAVEPAPAPKAPPPAASPPPTAPPATAAVSGWSDATEVSAAKGTRTAALAPAVNTPPVAPRAPTAAPPPAPSAAAAPAPKGKFRLQVAAVRSRAEAETMAARLKERHGAQIGGYVPAVDEVVLGNMGTFYRVRLGPFADASEPRQLCGTLKADGFDCLIVTK